MKQTISVKMDHEVLVYMNGISYSCKRHWFNHTMQDLKMDIIAPKMREGHKPCPAILWICGGAYRVVDRSIWMPEMTYLARRGYVVASLEYRTSNEVQFPEPLIDVKAAIRYLKAHAETFAIDPDRICVMGESAGGTLASLAGLTADKKEFERGDNLQVDSSVKAVVDFYGLVDFSIDALNVSEGIPTWTIQEFLGENYSKETAKKASAVSYVSESAPPFLILHGTKDKVVPIRQSEMLEEALKIHNVYHEVYFLEGAEHGTDEFYQEEVLQKVAAFLERVV
ncbi:MAG: alpha/beta hydrolase [Lachnospiraceae bacterium]|nr:alpha/beta hydrolase [Lachnospiraceae bacterium]